MKIYLINARRLKRRVSFLLKGTALFLLLTVCIYYFYNVESLADEPASLEYGNEGRVIIIDPGHGGEDDGATGANGIKEKQLNFEISMQLGQILSENGYTVVYTRTEDKLLYTEEQNVKGLRKINDLKNRCAIANDYKSPIFISVHMNYFGAPQYSGLQVYYADGSDESKNLAEAIQTKVRETLQKDNKRQIKNGKGLYVLDNCNGTAVIVECGFISNPEECQRLSEKEYQKELCFSIFYGIIEYMK